MVIEIKPNAKPSVLQYANLHNFILDENALVTVGIVDDRKIVQRGGMDIISLSYSSFFFSMVPPTFNENFVIVLTATSVKINDVFKKVDKQFVLLTPPQINEICDNAVDAFIMAEHEEAIRSSTLLTSLQTKLKIEPLEYGIDNYKSISRCNNEWLWTTPTPNEKNACDTGLVIKKISSSISQDSENTAGDMDSEGNIHSNDNEIDQADVNDNEQMNICETLSVTMEASQTLLKRRNCDGENTNSAKRFRSDDDDVQMTILSRINQLLPSVEKLVEKQCIEEKKELMPWYAKDDHWTPTVKQQLINSHLLSHKWWKNHQDEYASFLELINGRTPSTASLRCRICFQHRRLNNLCTHDGDHDPENHKTSGCGSLSSLAKETGLGGNDNSYLQDKIIEHSKSTSHAVSLDYFEQRLKKETSGDFKENVPSNQATCRMLRTAFAAVLMNIPFSHFGNLLQIQESNGAVLGHIHRSTWSAQQMTLSISKTMHKNFVEQLKVNGYPFSILLDTSTDASGRNFFLIYLRVFANNFPHVLHYKLLHIQSEKAADMFQEILTVIREDGLEETFRTRLVGFGSDGASVMTGNTNGMRMQFRNYFKKTQLVGVHCLAHKLELVIHRAMNDIYTETSFELYGNLTSAINTFSDFFGAQATKRKATLLTVFKAYKLKYYKLRRIFDIRWSASQDVAITHFLKDYVGIWLTLKEIIASPALDYTRSDKAQASNLLNVIENKKFYILLSFLKDVFTIFSERSKRYQIVTAAMPSVKREIIKFGNDILSLKEAEGKYLSANLKNLACMVNARLIECNMNLLSNDNVVTALKYEGLNSNELLTFRTTDSNPRFEFPFLTIYKETFLNSIVKHLHSYYDKPEINKFAVLDPTNFVIVDGSIDFSLTSADAHKELAVLLDLTNDIDGIGADFQSSLTNIFNIFGQTEFEKMTKLPSERFYEKILNFHDNKRITLPSSVITYISKALAIPVGSADVERGFSMLNHARYDRRSSLSPTTIDAVLRFDNIKSILKLSIFRIRLNSPDISKFNCETYAKRWISENHIESDDPSKKPRGAHVHDEYEETDDIITKKHENAYYNNEKWSERYKLIEPNHN